MKHGVFTIVTTSIFQTKKIAKQLGEEIIKSGVFPVVIALNGDLGAGKTTFVKGLAQGLGIKETVISPTFILIGAYKKNSQITLYHVDPYRLESVHSLLPDIKELLTEKNSVIAIEWAERLGDVLPKDTVWIDLKYKGENKREIIIKFASIEP